MFGFTKKLTSNEAQPVAQQMQTITPRPATAPVVATAPDRSLDGQSARSPALNAKHSRKMSSALGDIVSVFAQSPHHDQLTLKQIGPMVLPALGAGQYKVAVGQDQQTGFSRPIAAVLWARVSDDIDHALKANPNDTARLAPDAWVSGSKVWIVEAVGAQTAIAALTSELQRTAWQGLDVKYRAAAADGSITYGMLPPT
jgi:hemolysin-activating ACP:hemolysin acyltransferase